MAMQKVLLGNIKGAPGPNVITRQTKTEGFMEGDVLAVSAEGTVHGKNMTAADVKGLCDLIAPVGYIFEWAPVSGGPDLSNAQNVASYFGFGTWQAYGAGRVIVGIDPIQTEFNALGKTGGEKVHTLTISEIPSHQHTPGPKGLGWVPNDLSMSRYQVPAGGSSGKFTIVGDKGLDAWVWGKIGAAGEGKPHNNLQPYIVVYRWQRIE